MLTHTSRAVSADPADGSPHGPLFCTMKRDQQSSGADEQETLCCSQTNVGCTSCQMPAYTSQQSRDMWQGRVGDRQLQQNSNMFLLEALCSLHNLKTRYYVCKITIISPFIFRKKLSTFQKAAACTSSLICLTCFPVSLNYSWATCLWTYLFSHFFRAACQNKGSSLVIPLRVFHFNHH